VNRDDRGASIRELDAVALATNITAWMKRSINPYFSHLLVTKRRRLHLSEVKQGPV